VNVVASRVGFYHINASVKVAILDKRGKELAVELADKSHGAKNAQICETRGPVYSIGGVKMLVLSRKEGDEIVLPELDIVIRVLKVRGKAVSVGIEAPRGIRILRSELESRGYHERETSWDHELVHGAT
jgi:carbon storage regulator CsrA